MLTARCTCLVIFAAALIQTANAQVDAGNASNPDGDAEASIERFHGDPEEINAGLAALQEQDYASAYETFRSLAMQGDASAQYQLASLYHRGLGVDIDLAEASRWYARAAEQGYAEAQYGLGNMYLMGEGVEQDDASAERWYEAAAEQDHAAARLNLVKLRQISRVKPASELEKEAGEEPPDEVANKTGAPAEVAANKTVAKRGFFKRLFRKDNQAGADDSAAVLAENDDPEDEMPSRDAPAGSTPPPEDAPSRSTPPPGDAPGGSTPPPGDAPGGSTPLPEDAPGGSTPPPGDAPGGSTPPAGDAPECCDPEAAEEEKKGFFSRIFGRDNKAGKASQTVAANRDNTQDTSPRQNEAALDALEQSGAVSNYELGMAYALGDGVGEDHAKAFGHFVKSAEQDYAPAQYRVGMAYALGDGVDEDHARAFEYFVKSAEQDYAPAQYRVGMAHALGEGTEKDLSEAVEWYKKSALQGYAIAQRSSGMAYLNGEGVEQNKPLALAWYSLLSDGGNQMDVHRRDTLLQGLSSVEIQQAEKLKAQLQEQLDSN